MNVKEWNQREFCETNFSFHFCANQPVWCFRDMANSVTEPVVMALNIQCSDPHTGETRTLTCTMRPLLESSCPPDFMDTDQEPPTDTVSRTMDPSASPLTDEALIQEILDWTDGLEDPLMTPPAEVRLSSYLSSVLISCT